MYMFVCLYYTVATNCRYTYVVKSLFNFTLVSGGKSKLCELDEYMIECQQVTKWKLVGTLLGIPTGQLDIIENDYNNKAENCCLAMLRYWCDGDPNASLAKLNEEVVKLKLIPANVDISVIEHVKSFLLHRYDKARYSKLIKLGLPYKPEQFTNIAFIHHKHSEVTEESVMAVANVMYNGDIIIDSIGGGNVFMQSMQPSDYYTSCTKGTNILEFLHTIDSIPKRKPFLVLIEGAPGIGKTSICKEIAFQWSKNEKTDLTFIICLHETTTQNINSFETLFEYICPGKQITQLNNVSDYLAGGADKRIMVIIDGYEELFNDAHSNSKVFINNIIKHDILQFQKCDLVISARCAAAVIDLSEHKTWYRVELLGFTEERQQQYLESNVGSERDVVKLRDYLNAKPVVKSLCFHPLFINFMVCLYNHLEHLPKFQTELIDKFACIMILWVLQHQPEFNIVDISLSALLKNLPEKHKIALLKICNLAFSTLQEETVIFGSKHFDIHDLVETQSYQTSFGFFKVFESKRFSFHFRVIQEFLAAFFVTQSDNNLKNLWAKTEWDHKYINVWSHYFGLRKGVPEKFKGLLLASSWFMQTERLSSKILQNKINCLYLVYCLMELPDEGIYQQAKQVILKNENFLDIGNCRELTNEGLNIVTSFLSCYIVRQWEHFSLSNCSLDDDKLDNMLQLFMHKVKYMPKVDTLDLSYNQLTVKSVTGIFKMAYIMNTSKVLLSHNEKIKDEKICKILTKTPIADCNLKVIENVKTMLLFSQINVHNLRSITTLTNLYIIRCSLDGEVLGTLVTVLKTHETLSLLYLYDNNTLYNDLLKFFEVLKSSKHLQNVLVFEKSLSDININEISLNVSVNFTLFQVLLVSANKLLAQGASDHQILTALEYNPSIVHLQLNDCHITDEVMNKIAVILNISSQQWSMLDLSGSKIGDRNLGVLCIVLNTDCKVFTVKLTGNQLTSLSLIAKVICYLNPKSVDISGNSVAVDDGRILEFTEYLFTHQRQLFLRLTCDKDNIIICHKLDQASLAAVLIEPHNFTQLLLFNCSVKETFLINALQKCTSLKLLHLQSIKWNGEYLSCFDILERHQFILSVYECNLTDTVIENVVNFIDLNVKASIVLSTDNIFLAHSCSYEILEWHLTHNVSSMSLKLFYVCKCSLKYIPIESYLVEYFTKKKSIAEIILCKNSLENKQLNKIIDVINQQCTTKVFVSEDYLNCNDAVNKLSCSSLMLVGSKVVIGEGATDKQVARAASLISPSTLVVRMIKCNFTCKGFELLVNSLMVCDKIQEFTFCRSNFNNTWGYKILMALQNTVTIKRLHLTSSDVTAHDVDFLATALAAVISNSKKLERLSIAFNILPPTASSKILKGLSEITSLKQLVYYNNENCSSELASAITSNSGLEELRLNNYKSLQTDKIIEISVVLNRLSKLRVLSLTNHGISQTSAIDLAVAINDKHLHTLHLGSNNLQSEGTIAMAEMVKDISTLKNLVLNDNGITEEASDSLASLINANKNLEKLYLDNNLLKTSGMNKLTAILKQLTTLKVLNLKCNKLDSEAADGIAAAVTSNQSLEVINLSDNNLQTAGVIKVTLALKSIHCFKCLNLSKNQITEEAADNISAAIACNTGLEKLLLHDNAFKSSGIAIICAGIVKYINNLRVLRISNNYIQTKAADDIAEVIIHNPLLQVIDVGNNRLLSEGVLKITKALTKIHHVKELCMNANYITEEAADGIAAAITSNINLEKFSLDKNRLNSTGISRVCGTLKEISTLRVFLAGNNGITKSAADDIAEVITNNPLLECVSLGNNKLQTEGVIIIANALKQIHNLTVLSLDNNQITQEAADDIALAISSNTGLEKLWLNNNILRTKGIQIICQSLKQIDTLKLLQIENNGVNKEATEEIPEIVINNPLLGTLHIVQCDDLSYEFICIEYLKTLDMKVTDDVASNVAAVIFGNTKLEKLILKGTPFLDKGIKTIANALKEKTKLKVLHFCGCEIIENAADDVAAAIINNPLLQSFHLCYCKWKVQGFIKICHSLKKLQLTELSLHGICLTDRGIDEIQDLIASNKGLEKLRLLNNNLTDADIAKISVAFKETNSVRILNLASNSITEQAADDIVAIIINNPILESIVLSYNKLKSEGVIKIACALKRLSYLKTIALSGNHITEAAASDIAEVLVRNSGLEELWVNNNRLMSIGTKIICGGLKQIGFLRLLQLENNQITKEAADDIASVITNNPMIERLCLGENTLQTEGVVKITSAVSNVHQLKALTLHDNQITEDATIAIVRAIISNTELEKLWLFNNWLADKSITTIINALKDINTLKSLCLHSEFNSISEYAADGIAEVINNNPLLEHVFVCNFKSLGVRKITNALKSLSHLKCLVFNNRITEDVANDIVEVITSNCELEYLCINSNEEQAKWIHKLWKILKQISTLKRLNLSSNFITEESADDIAEVINSNRELEMLWLSNNKLKSAGINKITNALQHLNVLSNLDLHNNEFTAQAADGIAAVINNNPLLQTVTLGNNKLETEGVIKIANALKNINHLKVLELNNNCITDKAANAIADVIHSNTELLKVYLTDNNLQSNGIKIICKRLMYIKNLEVLQLESNSITEEAVDDIASVIINNPLLEELYLGNNRLLSKGALILFSSLKKIVHLKELSIHANYITKEAADDIAEVINGNRKLEKLWLHNNKLKLAGTNKITNALQHLNTLKLIQLSNNDITAQAADGIAAVINNNPLLQTVFLENSKLETEGVIKIANALKNINHLKVLGLNNNSITDKAANAIADVIHSNTELLKVYLTDNNLQSNGIKIICKSLIYIKNLKVLQLENNPITEEAVDDIASVIINNPLLEELYLGNNRLLSKGALTLFSSLKKIVHLKELSIHGNYITEEVADDIAEVINGNRKLKKLWLHDNKLKLAGTNKISNALQHLNTLKLIQLSNNDITTQAADGIAAVINNNPLLQTVAVGNNKVETGGVIKIANALKNINNLKVLELNNNCITDKAANAIADVIHSNTELLKVYLNDNNLQSNGIKIICKSLMYIRNLQVLQLENNSINEEAADDIAAVINSNRKLEKLWLCNNKLKSAGINKIKNTLQHISTLKILQLRDNEISEEAADGIAAVINNNPLLHTVTLGNNKLETEGVIKIANALKNINNLKLLELNNNCITDKAANAIADVIHSNTELEDLCLNNNNLQSNGTKVICSSLMYITTLKELFLQNNFITEEATSAIARVIINNPLLQNFDLSNNKIKEGITEVLNALKTLTHLKVLSFHHNQITDDAANDIAEVISNNCTLEKVWLNNNELKLTGIKKIAQALQHINTLKLLQLDDNDITEEAADGIAAVINNNPLLQTVILGNNKLETEGVIKVANALKNINHLKLLQLNNNCITDKAANAIADVIHSNTELEDLCLNNNNLQSNGTKVICSSLMYITTLKELLLQNNFITEEATSAIARVIINNPLLQNFDLSNNKIKEGITEVLNALKTLTHLKVLSFHHNQITDDAANDIAEVISNNCALEKVWLNNNELKLTGIKKIAQALQHINTLKLLRLDDNDITEEAADGIAAVINTNPLLQTITLGNNKLETEGVIKIANALKNIRHLKVLGLNNNCITDKAANAIADVIHSNTELEDLYLNNNNLQLNGTKVICSSLMYITTLKELLLQNNFITEEATSAIARVIINNPLLQNFDLSNNKIKEGITEVLNALKTLTHLKVLSFHHNQITDDAANDIAEVISNNCALEKVWLNNNELKLTGIKKIAQALQHINTLKLLQLDGNDITEEAADGIARVINNNPSLEILSLGGNKLHSVGTLIVCHSLKKIHCLKQFNICNNFIIEEAAQEIIEVINSNCELEKILLGQNNLKLTSQNAKVDKPVLFIRNYKLQELYLNNCLLKSSEVSNIMCALKTHTIIRVLCLHCNYITNRHEVADNISHVILNNCHMEEFYIVCNQLQARGITTVLESLKQLNSLKILALGRNDISEGISDELADVITNNTGLEMLGIDYTCVHSDGAAKMIKALISLFHLKLLEMPGNNIDKESADDIATVITTNGNLVKLYIADNYLGTVGVTKIAEALVNPRRLEVLDLTNNNITSEAAESISKVILANPSLQSLLLGEGCSQLRNAIKPKEEMSSSNTCNNISVMKLNNVFIAKQIQGIKEYTKIYGPSHPFNYHIVETSICCCETLNRKFTSSSNLLKCNYNNLQSDGVKTICKGFTSVTSLEVLSIDNNDVDDEAADDIAAALASNIGIKQLWIGENHFTQLGISIILQPLIQQLINAPKSALEVLDLSYSNLSVKETADNISTVLSRNSQIKQLWLEGNNLSSQCIATIANALKKCTKISVLSLRDNNITEEVADVLSEALSKNSNLQQLYLGNNYLHDREVMKITEALNTTDYLLTLDLMNNNISEAAADALGSVITSCSQLEQLYLGDNKLQSTGTIKIARALQQANCRSTLRVLDLSNNRIGSDETVGDEISRAVGNTELLTVLILDDNAFSVEEVWKITRSLNQSEYMMIFSVMRNDVMTSEETKDEMRAVMADQQPDCVMYL